MKGKPMQKPTLLEASLSRIYRDFIGTEFVIITSWRNDPLAPNNENLAKLKAAIKSAGLGYVRIDGVGQEENEFGEIVSVSDPALLVKNQVAGGASAMSSREFLKFMNMLARKYNQWGIVHSPASGGALLIAYKDDDGNPINAKVVQRFSKFIPMKVGQFFSKLKGGSFMFEGFKYANRPQNFIHGMIMERDGHDNINRYESMSEWRRKMKHYM